MFIEYKLIQKVLEKEGVAFSVELSWPSFLECLNIRSVFENFPKCNEENKLFAFIKDILAAGCEKELYYRLYDQVFVECLTQVKSLEQVNATYLLEQIQKKKSFQGLEQYKKKLEEHPYDTLHDLTLYLAWDRVTVFFASLFDTALDVKDQEGLYLFKECLVESFQHITMQGKTIPSFFRLIEALYAYYLRDENLQTHTESEWLALCQGSCTLESREELIDVPYIDIKSLEDKIFTLDSPDKVKARIALAHCIIEKLKKEDLNCQYILNAAEVVSIEDDNTFKMI